MTSSSDFPLELKPYFRGEWAVGFGLPGGRHEGPTQDALWPAAGQPRLQPAAALPPLELLQKGRLYMVADGVTSCADGSEASRLALETIGRVYYEQPAFTDDAAAARAERLRAAVWAGHQALLTWEEKFSCWRHGQTLQVFARERLTPADAAQRLCPLCGQRMAGLQATVLAAVLRENALTLASVGDSIAWRLPGNARQPLQELAAKDDIFLGSLGLSDGFLHVHTLTLEPGDRILLAGDGVADLFSIGQSQWREELRRRLSGETAQMAAAARVLLQELAAKGPTYPKEYDDLTLLLLHYPTAVELAQLRAAAPGEQAAGELPRLLLYTEDEALLLAADATTRPDAAFARMATERVSPTIPPPSSHADASRSEGVRRNKVSLLENIRRLAGLMTTTPTPDRARQLAADCQEFLARSDLMPTATEKTDVQEQLDRARAYLNEKPPQLRDREALLAPTEREQAYDRPLQQPQNTDKNISSPPPSATGEGPIPPTSSIPEQVRQIFKKLFTVSWSPAEVVASQQALQRLKEQHGAAAYVNKVSWRQKLQDAAADLTVTAALQVDSFSLAEMQKMLDAAAALDGAFKQAEGLDPQQTDAASHARSVLETVSLYRPFCDGGEEPGLPPVYRQRAAQATAAAQAQQAVPQEAWGKMLDCIRQWPAVSSPLPQRYVATLWQWALAQETNTLLRDASFRQVGEQPAEAAPWLAAAGEGVKEGLTALVAACRAFPQDNATLAHRLAAAAALRPPWQPAGMTDTERQGWQRHQQWFLTAAWDEMQKWLRQEAFDKADSQMLHAALQAIPATAGGELRAMQGALEILQHEAAIKDVLAQRLRAYAKATAWTQTAGGAAAPADVQRAVADRGSAGAEQVLALLAKDIMSNKGKECARLKVEHIPALPPLLQRLIDSGDAARRQSWPEAQTALDKVYRDPAYADLSAATKTHIDDVARFYQSKMARSSQVSAWKKWISGVLVALLLLAVLWLLLRLIRTPPNGELSQTEPATMGVVANLTPTLHPNLVSNPGDAQQETVAPIGTIRVIGTTSTPTSTPAATSLPATPEGKATETPVELSPSPTTVAATARPEIGDWLAQTQPPLPLGATLPTAVELSLAQAGIEVPADTVWDGTNACAGACLRLHAQLADFCGSRGGQEAAALNEISDQALYWPLRNGQLTTAAQAPVFGCLPASAPAFLLVAQLAAVTDDRQARLRFPAHWQLAETTAPLAPDAAVALRQWQVTKPDAWGIWLVHSDALAQALWRCRNNLLAPRLTGFDKIAAAERTCADQTALLAAGATWPVDRVFLALDMTGAATPSLVWYDTALDGDILQTWIFGDAFAFRRVLGDMPALAETGAWHGLARVTAWNANAAVFTFSHLFQRQDGDMRYSHRDGQNAPSLPVIKYILLDSP